MQNNQVIHDIRQFFNSEKQNGKNLITYQTKLDFDVFLDKYDIGVELDTFKQIVLQEETGLELGGADKISHSLVFPIIDSNLIESGKITLLGLEIKDLKDFSIDFSIFILIGLNEATEKDMEKLRKLSFISNGIEGFLIRSIPRRFWCRISSEVIQRDFSFDFLGRAIQYLYYRKFGNLIKSIEIFFINSYPGSIKKFKEITSDIRDQVRKTLKKKIDEWKKRIDCDYDWGCEICPYREECYKVKEVLVERERLEN